MRLSLGDRRTPCLNLTLDHKTAGIRLDNAPLTHFCWRPSLGVTWHGSETLPYFNRSDPFEPDPVDTGVGKGTDRFPHKWGDRLQSPKAGSQPHQN